MPTPCPAYALRVHIISQHHAMTHALFEIAAETLRRGAMICTANCTDQIAEPPTSCSPAALQICQHTGRHCFAKCLHAPRWSDESTACFAPLPRCVAPPLPCHARTVHCTIAPRCLPGAQQLAPPPPRHRIRCMHVGTAVLLRSPLAAQTLRSAPLPGCTAYCAVLPRHRRCRAVHRVVRTAVSTTALAVHAHSITIC